VLELPTDDDDDHSAGVEDSRSSFDSTAEYEAALEDEAALEENWPSTPARTPAFEAVEMLFNPDDTVQHQEEQQQQQQRAEEPLTQFPITPWNRSPEQPTPPSNGDF